MTTQSLEVRHVIKRTAKGQFAKGVSGSPGGKLKGGLQRAGLEEMARAHTPAALAALVAALDVPATRVPAAVALLDRGWGKPKQQVEASLDDNTTLHLVAAKLISAKLAPAQQRQLAQRRPKTIEAAVVSLDAPPPEE